MSRHPASAISLLTAAGCGICALLGVVSVAVGHAPSYVLLWCAAVAAVGGFNLWAAKGK
ncbi:hypothetical protein [Kutzneria sp. NPDC052558]|uniref:hypothetical protein n=1 Tax=Kutzneria sp. NPDC052558 TaxID=3364121 RepID=UPI0037CC723C